MENPSTFLGATKLTLIIKAAAEEIRTFLAFIQEPNNGSAYSSVTSKARLMANLSEDMLTCAREYAQNPEVFSTPSMLKMGKGLERAIKNFIRIEVRRTPGVPGAAQVVAKGIESDFRLAALKMLRKRPGLGERDVTIKFAGRSSIEFNVCGVNKALPFKFLNRHLDQVLDLMKYSPGTHLDARRTRTIVAADGDGTIYGGPTLTELPTLKMSPARESLNDFLKLGGVFLLVSGNDLKRTAVRLAKGLNKAYLNRCLLVGNGAASMYVFGNNGALKEVVAYRRKALGYLKDTNKAQDLDVIYIGDDGHSQGNDMDAFREVGFERSFVVAGAKDEMHHSLRAHYVPGAMAGANKLFKAVNAAVRSKKSGAIFTAAVMKEILKKARM